MVLIYSKDVDDFVNNVIDSLDVPYIRIGETDSVVIQTMDFSNDTNSYLFKSKFIETTDLEQVKSIWFNGGCILSGTDEYENKCYEVLNDAFLLQKSIKKIGKRLADFETNRLDMMMEAKVQGLKIPHTLITGDKKKLINFFTTYQSKNGIVSKRILDNYYYEDDEFMYNFNLTFPITKEILTALSDEFALSFFQERIVANFEIRVIYIDGHFQSTAIFNFENDVDIRTKFIRMDNLRLVPFKLPLEIEEKLKKVFNKFNLNYGSADLMYCDNEYYFLEINPTGQLSFINNLCNYNLENKVAQILKNGR